MGPAWGDGTTEIRLSGDIMGVSWVGPDPTNAGLKVEASVLFLVPLAADLATRWDPKLDGLDVFPTLAPLQAAGTTADVVDAKDFLRWADGTLESQSGHVVSRDRDECGRLVRGRRRVVYHRAELPV